MLKAEMQWLRYCAVFAVLSSALSLHGQTAASTADPGPVPPGYSTSISGGPHDFDYYAGAWTTRSRSLKARNVGSKDWQEFSSTLCVTQHLDGLVEISDMYMPSRGSSGLTVRAFDVKKKQWVVHYINSKTGAMDPPTFGGFNGSQGTLYGEDTDNGRPIKVEVKWIEIDHDHARWQQAFSYDNRTWETNWISDFTRADPAAVCENGHPKR